jgi:hypothetical protein
MLGYMIEEVMTRCTDTRILSTIDTVHTFDVMVSRYAQHFPPDL